MEGGYYDLTQQWMLDSGDEHSMLAKQYLPNPLLSNFLLVLIPA